ncbi:hypothetical protein FAGKG844_240039 [Frankia sp. AgKG'84/4]
MADGDGVTVPVGGRDGGCEPGTDEGADVLGSEVGAAVTAVACPEPWPQAVNTSRRPASNAPAPREPLISAAFRVASRAGRGDGRARPLSSRADRR